MSLAKIDVHMHLAGTGCNCSGCWISPSFRKRHTIRALQLLHRISNRQMDESFDGNWAIKISKTIATSELDYGVILGFAGATTQGGEPDLARTQMIIPPKWVFDLCRHHQNLLPGPSVNPHAQDALEVLESCIEHKAVLIKWLPSAQMINPSDKRLRRFYERVAESQIPLLIHCGGERTFESFAPSYNDVNNLEYPLSLGVKVICAHSATKVIGSSDRDEQQDLIRLLRRYDSLWVDNSGLCNPSRFSHLPGLARNKAISDRTLYGSDWPVPPNSFYYVKDFGWKKVLKLESMENWISRDVEIKRLHGYAEASLTRAHSVLANLDFWIS